MKIMVNYDFFKRVKYLNTSDLEESGELCKRKY